MMLEKSTYNNDHSPDQPLLNEEGLAVFQKSNDSTFKS